MNDPFALVLTYLIDAVRVLAMLAVLVLALVLRRRLGATASTLAAIGGGLLTLIAIFDAWWAKFGVRLLYENSSGNPMTMIAIISTVASLVYLIGFGLVAAAVFAGRQDRTATAQPYFPGQLGPGQPYQPGEPYQPGQPGPGQAYQPAPVPPHYGGPTSGHPYRPDPTA